MGHVLALVFPLANAAALAAGGGHGGPCQVVSTAGQPGQEGRGHQGGDQGDEGGVGLDFPAENPEEGGNGEQGSHPHGADPHRIDVVEVAAPELDALGRQPQGLVDDQVGHHRHHPGDGDVGIQAEDLTEGSEDIQLHEHQGDQGVEHHPDHPPGVAMGQPGEEIGPGQGTGIGVGHVDLELGDHHEQGGGGDGQERVVEHPGKADQVHLVGIHRLVGGHRVAQGQVGEQGAAQHLGHPGQDPAGAADQDPEQPAPPVLGGALRHEAQVIDLLSHLGDEGNAHGQRGAKELEIEHAAPAIRAAIGPQAAQHVGLLEEDEDVGQDQQEQPQGLGQGLQAADGRHPVGDQGNNHQGADQVTPGRRNVKGQLQGVGHDRRLQGEENEGEGGVNQ